MVTTTRQLVKIDYIKELQRQGMTAEEIIQRCERLEPRHKNPPPPPGAIAIGPASRKYKVNDATITRWVQRGLVPVVLRCRRYKYIDEKALADVVAKYKENAGQGKRTLQNISREIKTPAIG